MAISDLRLRRLALEALDRKRRNPEATAVFALASPPAQRRAAIESSVALQIAIDYLDSVTEEYERETMPLSRSLSLHYALADAVIPQGEFAEWLDDPVGAPGGYLHRLIESCRSGLRDFPAVEEIAETMKAAAVRCGEAQAHTHLGGCALHEWARREHRDDHYRWWEEAAGASSSVAVHALLCASADPATSEEEAIRLDAAYHPPIGALTVLLDDLVDFEDDRRRSHHSYLDYYGDHREVADRIQYLRKRAAGEIDRVDRPGLHRAILNGVLAFYLSKRWSPGQPQAWIADQVLGGAGPEVRFLARVVRFGRLGST